MRFFSSLLSCALLVSAGSALPTYAQSADTDQNVFVMGGPFASDYFGDTILFWDNSWESNFFAGVGYQKMIYQHSSGFMLGLEAGLGIRAGESTSGELWAGGVARFEMLSIGDISITPSMTAGFSWVTDTIGAEKTRAQHMNGQAPILFYLGPEIAISSKANPAYEGFVRVQHRSGGFGTIADLDGSNAFTLGLRYKY
jgi:hypothetical protein